MSNIFLRPFNSKINFYSQKKWGYVLTGQSPNQYRFILENIAYSQKESKKGDVIVIIGKKIRKEIKQFISDERLNVDFFDFKKRNVSEFSISNVDVIYFHNFDESNFEVKRFFNYIISYSNLVFLFDDCIDFEIGSFHYFQNQISQCKSNLNLIFVILNKSLKEGDNTNLDIDYYRRSFFSQVNLMFTEIFKISPLFNRIVFGLKTDPLQHGGKLSELLETNPLYSYKKAIKKDCVIIFKNGESFCNEGLTEDHLNLDFRFFE